MASPLVTQRPTGAEAVEYNRDGLYARLEHAQRDGGLESNPGSASAIVFDFAPCWLGDTRAGRKTADDKGCADPGRITGYSGGKSADGSNGSLNPNQNRDQQKGRKSRTEEHAIRRRKKTFCVEAGRKRRRKKTDFLTGGFDRVSE